MGLPPSLQEMLAPAKPKLHDHCVPWKVVNNTFPRDENLENFTHDCGDPNNDTICCGTISGGEFCEDARCSKTTH